MELTGLHLTLGGLGTIISLVAAGGSIWRFLIKPGLDAAKAEQEATTRWRKNAEIRLSLIEESLPADAQAKIAVLRKRIANGN